MADSYSSAGLPSVGSTADEPVNCNDVFAWLRPHSDTAREAFDASVNSAYDNPDESEHIRQFMYITGQGKRARSPFSDDSTEPDNDLLQWSGAFKLSLNVRPHDPKKGWYLGTSYKRQPLEVDLLLAPPTKTWNEKGIASKHARLFFNEQSYRMMLEARHTVTVTKSGVTVITQSQSRVIEDGELIQIGPCSYVFEYTELHSTSVFELNLIQFMKEQSGGQWSLNKLLSPGTVGSPIVFGKYHCSSNAFAEGTFGKVSAGWEQDGRPVAIKVFKQPNKDELVRHREIMNYIGYHRNLVQLRECVYHSDIRGPDAYCVYSPLAAGSLSYLFGAYAFDLPTTLVLLAHYLTGLSFLHERGIMHRDINPNNLVVTSLDDPTGVIIDMDGVTIDTRSTDHMVGTLAYLAPEIVLLRERTTGSYDKAVDIWALGLSMIAIHTGQPVQWFRIGPGGHQKSDTVTEEGYEAYKREMDRRFDSSPHPAGASFLRLIAGMTQYAANGRPSAPRARDTAVQLKGNCRGKLVRRRT